MKTRFLRVWALSGVLSSLVLCAGCEEDSAQAEVPVFTSPESIEFAAVDVPGINPPVDLEKPAFPSPATNTAAPATNSAPAAPVEPVEPAVRVVQPTTIPESLKVSAPLAEVIKLVQAGVSEDVVLAYITNSTLVFDVSSDAIVYLNDLGLSSEVITVLIQRDASPEIAARRAAQAAVSPLPPGAALTTPATNIYPGQGNTTGVPTLPPAVSVAVAPVAEVAPVAVPAEPTPQHVNVSYFYSSLAPYGSWVDVDGYGVCWQPTVAVVNSGWRPYRDNGRWLWTDAGWYWYSDYSWGWAPFHYGRWSSHPRVGWFWVPDRVWGPSWVSWRSSRNHCGWAPLPPGAHYVSGFGLYYRGGSVSLGFDFGFGHDHYNYLPLNRLCDRSPHRYYLPRGEVSRIHHSTTVINNYVVGNNNTIINRGIGVEPVARASRGEIRQVAIRETPVASGRAPVRRERLEGDGSSAVLVRSQLPKEPPVNPSDIAARTRDPARRVLSRPAASGTTAPLAPSTPDVARAARSLPVRSSGQRDGTTPANLPAQPRASSATIQPADGVRTPRPVRANVVAPISGSASAQNEPASVTAVPARDPRRIVRPPFTPSPAGTSQTGSAVPATAQPSRSPVRPQPSSGSVSGAFAPAIRPESRPVNPDGHWHRSTKPTTLPRCSAGPICRWPVRVL